jgi:hypothetical protein
VTLFEFKNTVTCPCGNIVVLQHKEIFKEKISARKEEEKKIMEIKNLADKISFLIVSTDYPKIDIEIEKQKFIEKIINLFPDKIYLYDLIYEPRFRRLEEQFRNY